MSYPRSGMRASLPPLPIDPHIEDIVRAVRDHRAAVVTAEPGAGKTTRVPPALTADGAVLLLQPRRMAARAIARRIAIEQEWVLGRDVGWHVRSDRNFSNTSRLIVATEGILTSRLQHDPLLHDVRTLVIDEFHERSIHADLGLTLAREAWRARDDFRIVVMSATMDAARVAAYLDDCPVIAVPGRLHPLEIAYHPGEPLESAVAASLRTSAGAILCFLPGAAEIRGAADRVASAIAGTGTPIVSLHGSLDADEQDAALRPSDRPRVVLATNLAETTVTVPDVTSVVDTGLHKVARYDADRAVDSLETERISLDSADQRAGRAGRVQAGRVVRLWDARDRLRPHREAEIARVDLAGVSLAVLVWGGDPRRFPWFEPPPATASDAAMDLLERLGAIDHRGALTPLGHALGRMPLHPRLGRILIAGRAAPAIARACTLLSERHIVPPRHGATSCDLLSAVDQTLPPHLQRVAEELRRVAAPALSGAQATAVNDAEFRKAILAGYPDRVGRRRARNADRFVLASGSGARLARESGVVNAEYIVAVDVTSGQQPGADALIRLATGIEPDWIAPTSSEVRHAFDSGAGIVRASRIEMYDAIVTSDHPIAADPIVAGPIIADAYIRRGPTEEDLQLMRRADFAGLTIDFATLVKSAAAAATTLDQVDLASAMSPLERRRLDEAPAFLDVPSGRQVRLEYRDGGAVVAGVKLQELFGLAASPRVGKRKTAVTFELLAPNGRPVQVTNDLASFWARGYAEVRKELRARYPKHPWPEDPLTARPTAKAIRRKP